MIVDFTQNELTKQMDLKTYFSDPVNVARALILAKSVLPKWYYEDVRRELVVLYSTVD